MTNKKRQEIIDYLEYGDRFSKVLLCELNRPDLTTYEKRTYSSLLDALNGATELYCAMAEWSDNIIYISREKNGQKEEADFPYSSEYLQGFMDCVKDVQEGGFKGMEDSINSMFMKVKVQQ